MNQHPHWGTMVKKIPKFSKYYKYFFTSSTQLGSLSSNLTFFWIPPGHHDWLSQALTPSKAGGQACSATSSGGDRSSQFQKKRGGPYKSVRYLPFPESTLHFCKGIFRRDLLLRTKIDFVGPHFENFLNFLNIQ